MITVPVNVAIAALNTSAVSANVNSFSAGVYTYDLLDSNGMIVAESRYSDPATAPFTLSAADTLTITI